jgi:hypothetical protein
MLGLLLRVNSMPVFILALMVLVSPTLVILGHAIQKVGWSWSLLWIVAGAIGGGILLANLGARFYGLLIERDDRKTGQPEAGAIGAATGRAIVTLIWMVIFGWIGSGLGGFLACRYWVV